MHTFLRPWTRASCPVPECDLPATATLSNGSHFPCLHLWYRKKTVSPQLSPTGINLTTYFWGLFSLPATCPSWFSLAVISLESEFRPIFWFSPQLSICTVTAFLIFQMGKHSMWIWGGGIFLCLIGYSRTAPTLLWLNTTKHCGGAPGIKSKKDSLYDGGAQTKSNSEKTMVQKKNNPKREREDTKIELGKMLGL